MAEATHCPDAATAALVAEANAVRLQARALVEQSQDGRRRTAGLLQVNRRLLIDRVPPRPRLGARGLGPPAVPDQLVRVLDEQLFFPPRRVEVEHNGAWWSGRQGSWRRCDDGPGWMAEVWWTEPHEWGSPTYDTAVTPDRVRLPAE